MTPIDALTRLQEAAAFVAARRSLPPALCDWLVPGLNKAIDDDLIRSCARSLVVLAAQACLGHLNTEQLAAARAIVAESIGTAGGYVKNGLIEVLGDTHPRGHGGGAD